MLIPSHFIECQNPFSLSVKFECLILLKFSVSLKALEITGFYGKFLYKIYEF